MPAHTPEVVAVLDMGATAIRLVIAEVTADRRVRLIEEASRGVLLGRDTFSGAGVIKPRTADSAFAALDGFRHIMDGYGVTEVRAVATSAVREARNGDLFLDRVRARTGISFDVINEAEETRLLYLAVRDSLRRHPALKGAWTLIAEVGGGSTSLTLLRYGQPVRSGVYALGAVRFRQRLELRRYSHEVQVALLKRVIANVIDEIRVEIPLHKVTQIIAVGGDIRLAASHIQAQDGQQQTREIPRDALVAFASDIETLDDDALAARFRLPAIEADTLIPSMMIYATLLSDTAARRIIVSDASLRSGMLMDLAEPEAQASARDFEHQVLASAEALGSRFRFDRAHGRHVASLATKLFDLLQDEHKLSHRERLLLQTAALLHDVGIHVSLRSHHKHSQYLLSASQIFGLSNDETAVVANVARYHRGNLPQRSHLPYMELDQPERMLVNKLSAILRVANALDAEHLQKVRDLRLLRDDQPWVLELIGTGDVTMEQLAGTARADLFVEVFGRELLVRSANVVG
ncbi:MAG: Ppx/GppA family phosphatase [Acidobacteria bacterium]|nr:Ppx/GppA family phosphatase [Acidobacteriota bacterium]